jgi:hypothetical protein
VRRGRACARARRLAAPGNGARGGGGGGAAAGALLELLREASESSHNAAAAQLALAHARAAASEAAGRVAALASRLGLELRTAPGGGGSSLSEPLTAFCPAGGAYAGAAGAPWPAAAGSPAALDAAVAAGLLQLPACEFGFVDPSTARLVPGEWVAECL